MSQTGLFDHVFTYNQNKAFINQKYFSVFYHHLVVNLRGDFDLDQFDRNTCHSDDDNHCDENYDGDDDDDDDDELMIGNFEIILFTCKKECDELV